MNLEFLTDNLILNLSLFLIIFLVVSQALKITIFKKNKSISYIIGVIIAILAVRYMTLDQIDFLAHTYSSLGTIILLAVPFIIVFFFIYSIDLRSTSRRILWGFYLIMNIYIFNQVSPFSTDISLEITIGIIFVGGFLILIDKWIRERFIKIKLRERAR